MKKLMVFLIAFIPLISLGQNAEKNSKKDIVIDRQIYQKALRDIRKLESTKHQLVECQRRNDTLYQSYQSLVTNHKYLQRELSRIEEILNYEIVKYRNLYEKESMKNIKLETLNDEYRQVATDLLQRLYQVKAKRRKQFLTLKDARAYKIALLVEFFFMSAMAILVGVY